MLGQQVRPRAVTVSYAAVASPACRAACAPAPPQRLLTALAAFPRSLVCCAQLTYVDLEAVDPEYFKALKWMLENDITDVFTDYTFTAETDYFGRKEVVELVPGGKEVKVTEANKRDYVNLVARHRMTTSIRSQVRGCYYVGDGLETRV